MNKCYEQITGYIDAHRDEMIEKWETLVNMEGHYDEKENVEKVQQWLKNEFEQAGFRCYVREAAPESAGVLVGILGEERPGKPVVFSGHMDTVHRTGSFGGPNPFRIEDGKAYGPGVLDMKGGIIIALYVAKALNDIGFDERPIKIVFAGEEEADHVGNDVDLFFEEQGKGAICAFSMETGHIENRLCVGRKAQYTFFVTIKGLGGHAGNEFTKGRNAIHEAVHTITEMMKLTDLEKGTTVTTSVIRAGGHTSAIPDLCEMVIDVRVMSVEEGNQLVKEADKILKTAYIEGTTTEYRTVIAKLRPFGPTEPVRNMLGFLNKVAADNDFPEFGQIILGGASDAGNIAASGIPVLCSCGTIGEYNHNIREYAVVESIFERAKIYALAISDMSGLDQLEYSAAAETATK